MNSNTHPTSVLWHIAERAMIDQKFIPDPPPAVLAEVAALKVPVLSQPRDLRALPWTSIDNPESRDLDQVEATEKVSDGVKLYVGIADVDSFVPRGSATDQFAATNTTSVYTGVRTFPMLPDRLSYDLTSLLADEDRLAMIYETIIKADGSIGEGKLYPALLKNRAKLDYPSISAWLDGKADAPANLHDPVLRDQIHQQDELSHLLANARKQKGALDLDTAESRAVIDESGTVVGLVSHQQDRAGGIIEELMIASNQTVARALDAAGFSSIRRVVKTPERWARIVEYAAERGSKLPATPSSGELSAFVAKMRNERPNEFADISLAIVKLIGRGEYIEHRAGASEVGHFGLATAQYTHSTAPNRRYVDLVTQRLIRALNQKLTSPYSSNDLQSIATHASEREAAEQKVERRVHKSVAASLLSSRVGDTFDALVTGASEKGTFVRVASPIVEGKLVRGEKGLKVGDKVRVKLRDVSVERGFIDFVTV